MADSTSPTPTPASTPTSPEIAVNVQLPVFSTELFDRMCKGIGVLAETDRAKLANGIVAVYHSAHWCGPCKSFTPFLAKVYAVAQAHNLPFEIVFASHDRDLDSFTSYRKSMPWKALPFVEDGEEEGEGEEDKQSLSAQLSKTFGVASLPTLIITHPATQRVLTVNGRNDIIKDKLQAIRGWCEQVAPSSSSV